MKNSEEVKKISHQFPPHKACEETSPLNRHVANSAGKHKATHKGEDDDIWDRYVEAQLLAITTTKSLDTVVDGRLSELCRLDTRLQKICHDHETAKVEEAALKNQARHLSDVFRSIQKYNQVCHQSPDTLGTEGLEVFTEEGICQLKNRICKANSRCRNKTFQVNQINKELQACSGDLNWVKRDIRAQRATLATLSSKCSGTHEAVEAVKETFDKYLLAKQVAWERINELRQNADDAFQIPRKRRRLHDDGGNDEGEDDEGEDDEGEDDFGQNNDEENDNGEIDEGEDEFGENNDEENDNWGIDEGEPYFVEIKDEENDDRENDDGESDEDEPDLHLF
ncbi:hypothetical protein QQS21_009059 [Conoideocrella luteorostrata]|uniref:Uncharacterized protein n=1 Tax=Conoideocrella luteorostrata TaxID=1105319 RepID=A0AAJ0FVD5_9HYPO|nr:hypothetical protein QQS21_009059 [Conoideocrella luteorostrata]